MNARVRFCVPVALFATVTLAGCAIGNHHAYHDTIATFQASGSYAVAVTVHDQREYIQNKDKSPDFVGLQRGGCGNPFNVTTVSGQPLAEDMTASIVASLRARGFHPVPVVVSAEDGPATVRQRLIGTRAPRSVLLVLIEWKADSMQNTALLYTVTLQILDGTGRLLAEKNLLGRDNLGGSFWNPPAHANHAVPAAFKGKLEALFNAPDVVAALTMPAS